MKSEDNKPLFEGIGMFPQRQGRQWYPTGGFKEIALMYGAAQRSYRQTVKVFNRSRHQEVGGTPLHPRRDSAQVEGLKVLDFLTRKSQGVFKEHGFDPPGMPNAECTVIEPIPDPAYLEQEALPPALDTVCEAMGQKGLAAADIEKVQEAVRANQAYEQAERCVYIHIDDVGVKAQKRHRDKTGVAKQPVSDQKDTTKDKRPTVQNTGARLEHVGKGFTLTGRSVAEILECVLGFLLSHVLLGLNIKVCTDGQRSLQDRILSFFSWHPHLTLLLDWFHVVNKFKEDLSLACQGRAIRNCHLTQLLTLLWFGLIDKAQAYLAAIPVTDLKDGKAIARLSAYLERHRQWMPC